jgi:type II secretory pathway pseudopilin PulG
MSVMRGFSLLELMLSMTLGLLTCALLLPVLQASLHSQRFALTRLDAQQDARFVLQQLGRDVRMAGSFGCAGPAQWPAGQWPAMPRAGTESLALVYADAGVTVLPDSTETERRGLRLLQTPPPWLPGQVLLLSSCQHIDRLVLGEQAWLEAEGDTVWLRLPPHHPIWQNLQRHHLLSLELQPLRQLRYYWQAPGSLWWQLDNDPPQRLSDGLASLTVQAKPVTVCAAGQQHWWWTVQLAMQGGSLPAYQMQLASRMGTACSAS